MAANKCCVAVAVVAAAAAVVDGDDDDDEDDDEDEEDDEDDDDDDEPPPMKDTDDETPLDEELGDGDGVDGVGDPRMVTVAPTTFGLPAGLLCCDVDDAVGEPLLLLLLPLPLPLLLLFLLLLLLGGDDTNVLMFLSRPMVTTAGFNNVF